MDTGLQSRSAAAAPRPMASLPLQAMDFTSLKAVLAELRPQLLPSRFEKAQQPDGQTLQLGLRTLEQRFWLELSWLAEAPRLLAIDAPPRSGEGSTLAQQLQHGLGGLALVSLSQPPWERTVELGFAGRPGEAIQRSLVLELMGRHSNLFLLDQQRQVVAAARQVREQQSRWRPIGTGDAYASPPPLTGAPPSGDESFERWQGQLQLLPLPLQQALQSSYQGISPALALQLAGDRPTEAAALLATPVRELSAEHWQQLWHRWRAWLTALNGETFRFSRGGASTYRCWQEHPLAASDPTDPSDSGALPLNRALAAYHRQTLLGRRRRQRQQQLRERLAQALAREQQQLQQQQQRLAQVESCDGLQRQADALLCLTRPSREQVAEAQALYQRARKLRRSVAAIEPRLELHQQRIGQLEASLTYLELLDDPDPAEALNQLQALESDSEPLLQARRRTERRMERRTERQTERRRGLEEGSPQPLERLSPSGLRLQVGRNHRQNDWISLRQARRGDLWFHAQECPGSHVVLKSSEGLASDGDLQAAADLAAHFSRARANGRVAVLMVAAETLQRIPGAGPGTVRHRGGQVIWGDPQRALPLLEANAPSLSAE